MMGYLFEHFQPEGNGKEAYRGWLENLYRGDVGTNLVDFSVRGNVIYVVSKYSISDLPLKELITADVILISRDNSNYANFGHKTISEFDGPYRTGCPQKLLKLLSPIEDFEGRTNPTMLGFAREWREKCWETKN